MDEMTEMWTRRRIDPSNAFLLLVTATALLGAAWLRYGSHPADEPLTVGAKVPPLQILDLETSEPLVLLGLSGKVVWITFWSVESASAPSSLKALEQASKKLAGHRLFRQVLAAVEKGKAGKIRATLHSNEIGLSAYTASPTLLRQFGVSSADSLFHVLIGTDGRILALSRGDDESTLDRLAAMAQRRLDEIDPQGTTRFAAVRVAQRVSLILKLAISVVLAGPAFAQDDPLPSWNEGAAKRAIISFVDKISKEGTPDFVPVSERIATFDNDGTLWCEQPMYVQAAFAQHRISALSSSHPEWKEQQPFKAVLEGDMKSVLAEGARAAIPILAATHAGMTSDEFGKIVLDWLAAAKHPRFGRPYTQLVYPPMLELMTYLRRTGFRTYIVSGGGVDFMRPWTERVYGIPPEQVIGSAIKLKYALRDGEPILMRLPEVDFIDDRAGKPVGIEKTIGRRPIAAFGNSDGDYEMLRWTTAAKGPRFGLIVHHTDAAREYAYDRHSVVGRLDRALDEAPARGWLVVDMKNDWRVVFVEPSRQ
jgi:hypothetical protein